MNAARVANLDEVHQASEPSINQSINQTNQSMHYFAIVKHASIQNAHVACCTLHVARCFYEFFDAAAAAISSKFATGSGERGGVDGELEREGEQALV